MNLNKRGYVDTGYVKYLTDEEFEQIKKYVDKLKSPSMQMCLKILMYLGLRCDEAVKLKRNNFSSDFSLLLFIKAKSKTPHERCIPQFLQEQLRAYWVKHSRKMTKESSEIPDSKFLFYASCRNQSKNPHLQKNSIRHVFAFMRRKLGYTQPYHTTSNGIPLYRISPHTLRHYAIWKYYKTAGNNLIVASQIIGHKKVQTTAKYINATYDKEREKTVIENAFNMY